MFKIKTEQFKTLFLLLLASVKCLLVPLHATPPTAEEIQAFEDYEDERGYSGLYPSPTERYEDAVEWRDGMIELRLVTLIRWRLAVAWMPFCEREQRLVGEWLSRKLFPDLYGERRALRLARKEARA